MSDRLPGRLNSAEPPRGAAFATAAVLSLLVLYVGLQVMWLAGSIGMRGSEGLFLLVLPLLSLAALLAWRYERLWIWVAVAGHFPMFVSMLNQGIGAGELLFASVTLFGLLVWLVKEVVICRRQIVYTGFDVLLVAVFASTTIIAFIGNRIHGGDMLRFFEELSPMFDLLLYFPLRRLIRTRRELIGVLALVALMAIVNGIVGISTYKARLAAAVYSWQVSNARVVANEALGMAMIIGGAVVIAYSRKLRYSLVGTLSMGLGLVFLVVSFSRAPMAASAGGVVIVMILSRRRGARRIAVSTAVALAVALASAWVLFPTIATTFTAQVGKRLSTLSRVTTDKSLGMRAIETNLLFTKYIPYSPLIGYGYGVTYKGKSALEFASAGNTFVHNGYVRPIYKYGYPLAILFYFFLLYPLGQIGMLPYRRLADFDHGLMIGCVGYLLACLATNIVSDMFSQYSGPFNYVVCWAIIDYLRRRQPSNLTSAPIPALTPGPVAAAGV